MKQLVTIVLLVFSSLWMQGQNEYSSFRTKKVLVQSDTLIFDSLSVIPGTFSIFHQNLILADSLYQIDEAQAMLFRQEGFPSDSVTVSYQTFDFSFTKKYFHKDSSMISSKGGKFDPYIAWETDAERNDFYQSDLNSSGSITRGITVGNTRDLAVNSTLNLQLSGKITDRFNILASITDDNLPIQPDGNTQQLQDFDRVYLQLYDQNNSLTVGDYIVNNRSSYFLNYDKKARGFLYEGNFPKTESSPFDYKIRAGAAVSKGRFARNQIQGIEGNQGPYRLTGAQNELFIIVLSGSEQVYIDGKLMRRGQDYDYVINYNTSEISFTANQLITKDKRIIVEFQYSDKLYARSLLTGDIHATSEVIDWHISAFAEQDSKNQPLQQELTAQEKLILSNAGDNFGSAVVNSLDSIGYSIEAVLYALTDSLGYDSILVFSEDPDLALYRASFSFVGSGNGDYVEDGFSANGRKFKWVAPDTLNGQLVQNGNYVDARLLFAPKKKQIVSGGLNYHPNERFSISTELSLSNDDLNSFSNLDADDDVGAALKTQAEIKLPVGKQKIWQFSTQAFHEYSGQNFNPIERYRGIEFTRDWNLGSDWYLGDEHIGNLNVSIQKDKDYQFTLSSAALVRQNDYTGQKQSGIVKIETDAVSLNFLSSFLDVSSDLSSQFYRQIGDAEVRKGKFAFGIKNQLEDNRFVLLDDTLLSNSYYFNDWQVYVGSSREVKRNWQLFYGERLDRLPFQTELLSSAKARHYGLKGEVIKSEKQQLNLTFNLRELEVINDSLTNLEPEETLLGRLDHNLSLNKGVITNNLFYELGSGLEQKREFIYIEVPAGQGTYIWNDYDEDGVRDLNEFEVAQYSYEANFIRTFIPSNDYVKTFSNVLSETFQINPHRIWSNEKGLKKELSKFSELCTFRIDRKTNFEEGSERFNPFLQEIADSSLISLNSSLRNTLFYNRTNPVWGLDYTFQNVRNKTLLSTGFESRGDEYHSVGVRWVVMKEYTLLVQNRQGRKTSTSDFLNGRNYNILYQSVSPTINWQPGNIWRIGLLGRYEIRENQDSENPAKSVVTDIGIEGRWSDPGKGILQFDFHWVDIAYDADENNALSFEMLEGLTVGSNFTWSMNFQRNLGKNLQMNFLYNGRKPEMIPTIHSGSIQVRAFF